MIITVLDMAFSVLTGLATPERSISLVSRAKENWLSKPTVLIPCAASRELDYLDSQSAVRLGRGSALEEETVTGAACVTISSEAMTDLRTGISVTVPIKRFPDERWITLISNTRQLSASLQMDRMRAPA